MWLLLLFPIAALYLLRQQQSSAGDIRISTDALALPDMSGGASGDWSTPSGASGSWEEPRQAAAFAALFDRATATYRLPVGLLSRVAQQESCYNAAAVNKKSGAAGLMQFMPYIAARLDFDPFDASAAVDHAGQELQRLYRRWRSWRLALASYNWGEGNLSREGIAKAPAETVRYVTQIAGDLGL